MDKYRFLFYVIMFVMLFFIGYKLVVDFNGEVNNDYKSDLEDEHLGDYIIKKNKNFGYHNTSERNKKIEYIVIHYTGIDVDASEFMNFFNNSNVTHASADYFVAYNGDIYQYNLDIENRYSWSVGGEAIKNLGGSLYGIVDNENSINIELCVKRNGAKEANKSGWKFNDETIDATIDLVKYLMKKYDIPVDNVVRHYDVNGKLCPGIIGWNQDSGSEQEWLSFKNRISFTLNY